MQTMKVFVHLSTGQNAHEWEQLWRDKKLIGFNDPSPYGYARANALGCDVVFSKGKPESHLEKYFRWFLRLCLGFDYIHALNNKTEIYQSDIVWTHTETQYLAVALMFLLNPKLERPKLIGQSVWLFDQWHKLSWPKKIFFKKLIEFVDVLTVHSTENLAYANKVLPNKHIEYVRYGIPSEMKYPFNNKLQTPIEVLALGNDKHRDWETLIKALGNEADLNLTIITTQLKPSEYLQYKNIQIVRLNSQDELIKHFNRTNIMVIPLKENMHASGITVMQEAALMGVPIVVSDTGGLRDYFDESCVNFIPVKNVKKLREAILTLSKDPTQMALLANNAQSRICSGKIDCQAYIQRHVELSRALLKGAVSTKTSQTKQSA